MAEPTVIQKRAIDVTPHNHALWCSVEGLNKGEPFANTIEYRGWTEEGDIVFGLDTHNGFTAKPDKMMAVVEVDPGVSAVLMADWLSADAERMAKRPVPTVSCPHCGGTGKVPK